MWQTYETVSTIVESSKKDPGFKLVQVDDGWNVVLGLFRPDNIPERFSDLKVDKWEWIGTSFLRLVVRDMAPVTSASERYDLLSHGDLDANRIFMIRSLFNDLSRSLDGLCSNNESKKRTLDLIAAARDSAILSVEVGDSDEKRNRFNSL